MRATPEASSGQVPEAGSGQALQCRGLQVKNEVGALATSIIYEPKAFLLRNLVSWFHSNCARKGEISLPLI